jgi:S-DNA-T family DNA segregation ATPase FtsK/SpoIIIE
MGRAQAKRGSGGRGQPRVARALRSFLFGHPAEGAAFERAQETKGLLMIGLGLWLAVALYSFHAPLEDPGSAGRNWGGRAGYYLARIAFSSAGLAGYLASLLLCAWGLILVARRRVEWASLRIFGALCLALSSAFLLELSLGGSWFPSARLPYGPGGWLARQATPYLQAQLGVVGLWILLVLLSVVSFTLATEMAFYPALRAFSSWARERRERRGESLVRAVFSWCVQLVAGLWNFVSGRDLEEARAPAVARAPLQPARKKRGAVEEDSDLEEEEHAEDDYEDDSVEESMEDDGELGPSHGEEEEDEEEEEEEGEEEEEESKELLPVRAARVRSQGAGLPKKLAKPVVFDPPTPPKGPWRFPPLELLGAPEIDRELDEAAVEQAARKLEHALASFRVEAGVVGAQIGPTVTLFELEVAQGTRMNKVTQLSQEIAAALRAQSVRIIAPIPGKATIGIEVPNAKRRRVRISELVTRQAYDKKLSALPLFLGIDAEGRPVVEDLARMPHLLVAGTTGSGKSVCINTILASFLLTRSPHDVQLILIDPKMVELQAFASIPHLMLPVVTDMRQATNVLLWAVEKMEGRYEVLKNAGVRNIKSYNALSEQELKARLGENWNEERTPRHLPYIVVVIDEFADLMMASKKEAEAAITRLAQKSRAVGIHVILATQRPSIDVITGVIKGNLPTRIAFQVASKVDSRVIIDTIGAEKLLGGGDMLYNPPQSSRIHRVQGALVEDAELSALIEFVCKESAPSFNQELVQVASGTAQPGAGGSEEPPDELWNEAVRVILKSKRGSASLLQRALGIGYTRASRLLDQMGEAGLVGAYKGSKAREVLVSLEDWEATEETHT